VGLLNKAKGLLASVRLNEETLYAQVYVEIEGGDIRQGLWLKALAESDGDAQKAKARYAKARVNSLKDEATLALAEQEEFEEIIQENLKKKAKDITSINTAQTDKRDRQMSVDLNQNIFDQKASIEEIQFFFRSHGYRLERWSEGWIVIDPLGGKVELGGDHEVSLHASKMIVRKKNGLFSPEYNVR
jgi:hypothetical protein|tara:strand:- start:61 stop:621 length:561 start_codon:yes stop_codon:yes gene_type:complete